ncbi:hypothetical protein C8R43DRAFT_1205545 [Mycena crocata]|nr:hypothetical protein C8R43DRAFT_1205545 [Mycena crocata]
MAYDLIVGCFVLASWANMILYTIQYFTDYPRDSWFNKGTVILSLCTDTVTVLCSLIVVYLYTVSHWGEGEYLLTQPWAVPCSTISAALTNIIVQIWLTVMVYKLTKQWIWPVLIGLLILPGLPSAIYTAHLLLGDLSYAGHLGLDKSVTIWFTTSVAVDVMITVVLVWKFGAFKTRFSSTKSLLRRLMLSSLRNGSITTLLTIPTDKLSMLSNLNNRQSLVGESGGSQSVSATGNAKRTVTNDPKDTVLRIRQDIETHYHTDDAEVIPMGDLEYGRKAREADGTSDVDLAVMSVKH